MRAGGGKFREEVVGVARLIGSCGVAAVEFRTEVRDVQRFGAIDSGALGVTLPSAEGRVVLNQ